MGRRALPPRKPYSRVFSARFQTTSEYSFGKQSAPPRLGVLPSDIKCQATRFVAAGCLPLSKLTYDSAADNSGISTTRGRDDCGKPFSQHLSFGATITATQGCDRSADSAAGMAGAATPLRHRSTILARTR